MRKIDIGTAVQMLANLGVIVGIVFLVIEIRGNTTATQAQTLQSASTADQEFLFAIGADSRLTRLWTVYLSAPQDLAQEERMQATYLFAAQLRRLENVFLQYQMGALPEEAWQSRQDLFVTLARSAGYTNFVNGGFARSSSDEMLEYLDSLRLEKQ